jgi:hypothetical protein
MRVFQRVDIANSVLFGLDESEEKPRAYRMTLPYQARPTRESTCVIFGGLPSLKLGTLDTLADFWNRPAADFEVIKTWIENAMVEAYSPIKVDSAIHKD